MKFKSYVKGWCKNIHHAATKSITISNFFTYGNRIPDANGNLYYGIRINDENENKMKIELSEEDTRKLVMQMAGHLNLIVLEKQQYADYIKGNK